MDERRFEDLLEPYALNALSKEEREEFEDYLLAHPECQAQVDELVAVTSLLALAPEEYEPSKNLRESVINQVRSEASPDGGEQRPLAGFGKFFTLTRLAGVAAAAVVVALISWNVLLQAELSDQQSELQGFRDGTSIEQVYALQGTGEGMVIQLEDHEPVLMADGLPPVPEDMEYQIWCITGDKTIPAGSFRPEAGPVAANIQNSISDAEAVAVTLEPAGGSPEPTSDPILVAEL